jgi:aminobenzoyl-glutamate utilization protein B
MPLGVPLHSWQAVASCGSSIGFKSMLFASKVLSQCALELARHPEMIAAARDEHIRVTDGRLYRCPIPDDLTPTGIRKKESA